MSFSSGYFVRHGEGMQIELSKEAEGNGFAEMLSQLLSQNMQGNDKKIEAFQGIRGKVSLEAPDIEERVSLDFQGDTLKVSLGLSEDALLTIHADSISILNLARIKICFGLPWFFDSVGLEILGKILTGKVRIQGLFSHPLVLIRVTKVFSVG